MRRIQIELSHKQRAQRVLATKRAGGQRDRIVAERLDEAAAIALAVQLEDPRFGAAVAHKVRLINEKSKYALGRHAVAQQIDNKRATGDKQQSGEVGVAGGEKEERRSVRSGR